MKRAYSSQAQNGEAVAQRKNEQKSTGVGVRQRGRCHVGGSSLPTNHPTGPQLLSHTPPSPVCLHTRPRPTVTEWTPYARTCVFSTSGTLPAHWEPFSSQFTPYLLSVYLNLTPDARNTLYPHLILIPYNTLEKHFIIRKTRPGEVN